MQHCQRIRTVNRLRKHFTDVVICLQRNERPEHRPADRGVEQGDDLGSRDGLSLDPSADRAVLERGEFSRYQSVI